MKLKRRKKKKNVKREKLVRNSLSKKFFHSFSIVFVLFFPLEEKTKKTDDDGDESDADEGKSTHADDEL